jgi:NADPH-dependent curcumin reductase CurA
MTSREIRLAARPSGEPQPSDFELAEVEVGEPGDGEIVVRNTFMSVDPYMRGRMDDRKSYVPPFALGESLTGGVVGEVVASRAEGFGEGDVGLHQYGWREYAVVPGRYARTVDTSLAPASAYLGVLGMPGLTAYVGLLDIAALRPEDVVFVSGAAGAVGSLAGPIAKVRGHTVIGSAGSPEKVSYVRDELGFDAAFDYHYAPVFGQLRRAAPDGIDVYFDNVGGDHLAAAIGALRHNGRVALCGAISKLQRARGGRHPQPRARDRQAPDAARVHRRRPRRPPRGVHRRGRRLGPRRPSDVPRDDRRRRRRRGAAGVHRPAARRQRRQDARAASLSRARSSDLSILAHRAPPAAFVLTNITAISSFLTPSP